METGLPKSPISEVSIDSAETLQLELIPGCSDSVQLEGGAFFSGVLPFVDDSYDFLSVVHPLRTREQDLVNLDLCTRSRGD